MKIKLYVTKLLAGHRDSQVTHSEACEKGKLHLGGSRNQVQNCQRAHLHGVRPAVLLQP